MHYIFLNSINLSNGNISNVISFPFGYKQNLYLDVVWFGNVCDWLNSYVLLKRTTGQLVFMFSCILIYLWWVYKCSWHYLCGWSGRTCYIQTIMTRCASKNKIEKHYEDYNHVSNMVIISIDFNISLKHIQILQSFKRLLPTILVGVISVNDNVWIRWRHQIYGEVHSCLHSCSLSPLLYVSKSPFPYIWRCWHHHSL